jgi:23S rRNA (adenine2503-C2)-methyltransferase
MPTPGQLTFAVPRRSPPPRHLADLVLADRRTVVVEHGHQPFRADQLSRHYFGRHVSASEAMTDLPAAARDALAMALLPPLVTPVRHLETDGGTTRKTLWRLFDGALVESVLMRYAGKAGAEGRRRDRVTLCVSSQAGCGMSCPFCATGQAGGWRSRSPCRCTPPTTRCGTSWCP